VAIEGEIIFAIEKHDTPRDPEQISLSDLGAFVDIVSRSMKYLGATVCGDDFIVTDGTVSVIEMNSNPFVFQIKQYLDQATLAGYFLRLEELLRRDHGHQTQT
jgi:D-alanine-D-alanine ligase-like ATP-grasp enzyme